ncbi:C40 family peptidase [Streptomyces sp. NEAU-Y11]|uniref:C40 family peptidase n=1 Tax=Streptomyces cucumeris TaxID=2962890 RepID=UPI0020C8E90A|nr:NlpC/P60 family protein [Streptomyces sp. NEAU-Y11]MCP9209676.1 C40 family peptidase [Streptomyces sp. NEAU-Y11]
MTKIAQLSVSAALTAGLIMAFTPTSAHAAPTIRSKALSTAAAQKNDPYRGGAAGPNAYDCSGLTYYSYKRHGKRLPRTAQGQYNASIKVTPTGRRKGDLVFIGTSSGSVYHVGIYAGFWSGKGWMWNANSEAYRGKKVVLAPIREYTSGSPKAYYGRF